MKKLLYILCVFSAVPGHSQSTPATDPAMWGTPVFNDEFNGSVLSSSWTATYDYRAEACLDSNCNRWFNNNAFLTDPTQTSYGNFVFNSGASYMSLVVNTIVATPSPGTNLCGSQPCPTYTISGPKQMNSTMQYKYGFFEINCRLPALTSGKTNHGIGPNFWLMGWDYFNCISEIDVFEFLSNLTYSANNYWVLNSHYKTCSSCTSYVSCPGATSDDPFHYGRVDFSGFRKFGLGWYPDKIQYFLDDQLIYTSYNNPSGYNPVHMVLDMNMGPGGENCDASTILPYSYDIDYVKVWKLTFDCSNSYSPTLYNTPSYNNTVKYDVTLGGGSNTYIVPSSTSVSLKASHLFTIDEGFEVGNNSTFFAEVTPCQP